MRFLSHPSRVRELKPRRPKDYSVGVMSHPSRVRELKHMTVVRPRHPRRSHPSRVRELKREVAGEEVGRPIVAPLPGA